MFDSLSERLGQVFDRLRGRGALSESDVGEALREVRVALLEADVALPVVKDFIARVKAKAVGRDVLRSVTPGQQVVKIVHDELVATLGAETAALDLAGTPPVVIMMVGLQGSGKTTTTAKIAKQLKDKDKKRVLMASLDVARPAAQEQLKILGGEAKVPTLPIIAGQMPVDIARRAVNAARLQGFDVVLLDTAGRLHVDASLMAELGAVKRAAEPLETLLVADALTGQDAVNVARDFDEKVGITGAVLTRMDGDGRGGAALSLRAVTKKPIKLIGVGEKLDAIEPFHPERVAGLILGMGDVVSLVEKAAETIAQEDAEKLARKLARGAFDLNDLKSQLQQMRKLGGMQGVLAMLPGVGKLKSQLKDAKLDDAILKRQEAIIGSMTPHERANPKIIAASRKRRIAAGSGTSVADVNKLLKMHQQMGGMMKRMKKMGKRGIAPGMLPPGMENLIPRR
ncbi:MAG: signal recognition particle protein [Pseudomonadota bacterium]